MARFVVLNDDRCATKLTTVREIPDKGHNGATRSRPSARSAGERVCSVDRRFARYAVKVRPGWPWRVRKAVTSLPLAPLTCAEAPGAFGARGRPAATLPPPRPRVC